MQRIVPVVSRYALLLLLATLTVGVAGAQSSNDGRHFLWDGAVVLPIGPDASYREIATQIERGDFAAIGVSALRLPPHVRQARIDGGADNPQRVGMDPVDFTSLDGRWGDTSDLERLLDVARSAGLRIILDVNVNSAGTVDDAAGDGSLAGARSGGAIASTDEELVASNADASDVAPPEDAPATDAPAQSSGDTTRTQSDEARRDSVTGQPLNATSEQSMASSPDAPGKSYPLGWGPQWIRASFAGYEACGPDEVTRCVDGRPDFRTEVGSPTGLPSFLLHRWGPEQSAMERSELDEFFARTKYPRTPRYYIVKWLSDWVRDFGVDGFYALNVDHVDVAMWTSLKREASLALVDWRASHTALATEGTGFWLYGDARPTSDAADELMATGFDALSTMLDENALVGSRLDSTYLARATALITDPMWGLATTVPTDVLQAGSDLAKAARWLLLPGTLEYPAGIELAADADVKWKRVATFRRRHVAVGAGEHVRLGSSPYVFSRAYRSTAISDVVIIALGADGRTRINVSSAFPDDSIVRDAMTGNTAFVSFGYVSFTPDESGILLLELAD